MQISVLMSIYQKESPTYFRCSLDSILTQIKAPAELCIMVDGPLTKELEEVLSHYQQIYSCIRIYRFLHSVMLGYALQQGVLFCKHDLIARMDTDDIAREDRLTKQYQFMMEHPEIDVLGGSMEEFDAAHRQVKRMPEKHKEILQYAKYRNPINHMTAMFRKQSVIEAGNYQHLPYLEDYDLWNRMLAYGKQFYNLPDSLVEMRCSPQVYRRRSGWNYFKTHQILRKRQKQLGLLTKREYQTALSLSFLFAMQPPHVRFVSHYLLRTMELHKQKTRSITN